MKMEMMGKRVMVEMVVEIECWWWKLKGDGGGCGGGILMKLKEMVKWERRVEVVVVVIGSGIRW